MRKAWLAAIIGGVGLVVAVGLAVRESDGFGIGRVRVEVADATATALDTIAVRGRIVRASLDGIVIQIEDDGEVWLNAGGDAVALRFPEEADVEVEDRLLVAGRLRARGGRRWLAVTAWSRVEASVTPPPSPGL